MKKNKWIWMPHPAHFICASDCKFFLSTYVGKYIVSTVGEYYPDSKVRDILGLVEYGEVGSGRKYETMVFSAIKSGNKCCPYKIEPLSEIDSAGYNSAGEATAGHYRLCKKWGSKKNV